MKNFTISLYGFHLHHTLTDPPDAVAADAALLWENLVRLGESSLQLPGLRDLRSQLICYQNGKYDPKGEQGRTSDWLTYTESGLPLGNVCTRDGFQISGDLQPFRLNDTYAVDLTLFPPVDTPITVQQLKFFNSQGCLLPSSIQASLGQTLWLYGEVDTADEECEALARVYVVALVAETNLKPVLVSQGKLLGSPIFEYQAMDPDCSHPAQQCHILVSLNNSQAPTGKLAAAAYDWVLNWLWCRHKIFYSYYEARDRYPDAQQLYSAVEQQVNSLPKLLADPETRLESLSDSLIKIPLDALNYTRRLRDLEAHQTTIATNAKNYSTCLKNITTPGDNVRFWQKFSDQTCNQWQTQIHTDLRYLAPGRELFGQLIDTIQGIVEIEQAQSERQRQEIDKNLQIEIQSIGAGLAAGSFIASSSGLLTIKNPISLQLPSKSSPELHPFIVSVLISLVVGLAFYVVTRWVVTQWIDKRSRDHKD